MKKEKVKLLWTIFNQLGLNEIPSSMVSRRMTVFRAFNENEQAFLDPSFAQWFWNMFEEGKTQKVSVLSEGKITPNHIFSFINDNQNLWTEAFACKDEGKLVQEETDLKTLEQCREITERNKIQKTQLKDSLFLDKLLSNLTVTDAISYPDYEKEILYLMEGMTTSNDENILDEAVKAYVQAIYKGDATNSHRLLLEEFKKGQQDYKRLGLSFEYPELKTGEGKVSRMMDATYIASTFSSGVFELRRIISVVNRIGEVGFSENEVLNFFKAYLDGGLDNILLNPPDTKSYFKRVEKTIDYDFKIDLNKLFPPLTCVPQGLAPLFSKLLNIMTRVKIVEWSKNVPIGEEISIIDLLFEAQKNILKIIEEDAEELVPLEDMFMFSNVNVINNIVEYFSKKLAYSYLLGIRKGGIGKELLDSFRNLSSPRSGLGIQILDLKKYYIQIFSDSWQKEFYYDFVLGIASRGLSSSRKETVRERVNLLVQKDPKQARRQQDTRKKIASELIFNSLKQAVPFLRPDFTTPEGADEYFGRAFLSIKTALNMVWIKKILRTGFDLYIEHPVTRAWTNEMEDLSREMIRYTQNLTALNRPSSEINELMVESLREAFGGLYYVNQNHVDQEVLSLFLKLPESPSIIDPVSVQKYLDSAFQESKTIINGILKREVKEEFERKTFDQEIEERISLSNNVIDWYVKSINTFYDHVITEPISLERTTDPNDTLLKTLYGGVFFLIEESMDLLLNQDEKLTKASFLRELFFKQVLGLKGLFIQKKIDYSYQILIDYILEQIELWDSVFRLRALLTDLEGDNRLRKAVNLSHTSDIDGIKAKFSSYSLIEEPGVRGLAARELVVQWIKKWANSAINLTERIISDIPHTLSDESSENFEDEIYGLLFTSTGRDDIRNFMVPLILGSIKEVTGIETCRFSSEFSTYGVDVFSEAVKCDSQLSLYFLSRNWTEIKSNDRQLKEKMLGGSVDFIAYLGTKIESCRQLIGSHELKLSDVVKKATGLSLSGLKLQTIVFQLGNKDIFSAATYAENPFEGSEVTGLTLELISKENIPIGNLHPLCENASGVLAGLIERNSNNASNPDSLYKAVVRQLLDEAKLILLYDSGTLKERFIQKDPNSQVLLEIKDISRTALRITGAYKIKMKRIFQNNHEVLLPEEVSYFGERLENFGLFVQLIFPFFEPAQLVKEHLMDDQQLMKNLGISRKDDFENEIIFPSLVVFDDNGSYKVILGTYEQDILKMVIAEEDPTSKMGLRTIQYLLKTRSSFVEFTTEIGLLPLPELNRSIPLNLIKVLKEKDGITTLNFQLIKNIQLGAI